MDTDSHRYDRSSDLSASICVHLWLIKIWVRVCTRNSPRISLMVADIDPLIFELSAFIRAIRGIAFSVASVASCKTNPGLVAAPPRSDLRVGPSFSGSNSRVFASLRGYHPPRPDSINPHVVNGETQWAGVGTPALAHRITARD